MKKLIILFLIAFQTVSLSADQILLNFLSSNNDPERQAVIRYLFDAFEIYHPDISVRIVSYDDNDPLASILSGQSNHLIMADSLLMSRISRHQVLDRDMAGRIIREQGEEDFYTGGLKAFQSENGYNGIPYSAWLQVIWYRANRFTGESLAQPDTAESLLQGLRQLRESRSTQAELVIGSANDVYMRQCFVHLAQAMGLEIQRDKEGAYLSRRVFSRALKYYRELLSHTPPGDNNWRYRDYYFQNKVSVLFYSTHLMDDFVLPEVAANSLGPENFSALSGADFTPELLRQTSMITTFTDDRSSSFGSLSGLGLFRYDDPEIRQAQEKLVKFLFRPDVYTTWLHMSPGGMLPVRRSMLAADHFYRDTSGIFKSFGRQRVRDMISGIEQLSILDPALAGITDNRDFQDLIYSALHSDDPDSLMDQAEWLR
jgi:multiple sugar transport system substrate-binding protein